MYAKVLFNEFIFRSPNDALVKLTFQAVVEPVAKV